MSSQSSSPYPILFASFNQDNRYASYVYVSFTHTWLCDNIFFFVLLAVGAFNIVEMLYSSSLLAIVGAGEQPSLSPRCLCLFNTTTGNALRELNFLTSILAVRLNKKRLVVVLREKTYIYDANTLAILDTIDTVPNLKGLCAFSPSLDACYLALPASTTKGTVLVYNVMELLSHCEIDAHRAPLAAIVLSSNGMYIATASEQGTIIRVFLVSEATKSYSFRRGTYPSTIYSLSFGPSTQLQDILVATSSSGSVHVFSLGFAINHRSRRSSSILGSILPESVNDVLDPAHHHVLHNAFPPGVKSYAVVRKVDRVPDTSSAEFLAIRASISIITYNGYFQEYTFSINNQSESLWSLEREFNLLTVIADNNKSS
ncbi:hypothetical protein EZV62_012250 [Acer yangbiense]|uniref:Autophagy-related protein 18b n=1 Tax=Acer yangbiense TaxID=1000413 RepID=A0A5C7HUW6_9ROSI|nr:hypothetical protein EZV62_012250 [Acer yangbiense]